RRRPPWRCPGAGARRGRRPPPRGAGACWTRPWPALAGENLVQRGSPRQRIEDRMTPTPAVLEAENCTPNVEHAMGADAAIAVASTLKALAEPLRLRMLSAIATDPRGESCVCDLAELTDVSQP